MRYDKGHKDETRRHILDVASAQFRESGIAAVGLAGIMSEAGLTNGAFYSHFASKEDLVREVLTDALTRREERHKANLENGVALGTTIRDYLSARHRDRAGTGCPTAALAAEIARHPKATREAFTEDRRHHRADGEADRSRLRARAAAQGDHDLFRPWSALCNWPARSMTGNCPTRSCRMPWKRR
ncbi:TetR/AcrR family transcriptional regulator [Bradyrhizobium manausense]|uniref:TetR/AcrR family transcriptional regulator n=1 Tax=Bradyrhizobium manausense TaxID=989370 RepID=UPI002010C878|nr:TetR family transcriptional regulator [Bradyrhizobium manausense]